MQNGLEDEEVIKNGVFVGLISEDELASKFGVGVHTVKTWVALGKIEGHRINGYLRFRKDTTDPRKTNEER
jgi:transposase